MLNITTATKLGEIMEAAASMYRDSFDVQFAYDNFADCVGSCFWKAFEVNEQSQVMQEVYCILCDMGFTPVESHK